MSQKASIQWTGAGSHSTRTKTAAPVESALARANQAPPPSDVGRLYSTDGTFLVPPAAGRPRALLGSLKTKDLCG